MKFDRRSAPAALVTLETVLARIAADVALPPRRKRDLMSAVRSFARLAGQRPVDMPLDLDAIRRGLDRIVPAKALISPKRWANLRSDLAAAIDASGLCPMLMTARIEPAAPWRELLASTAHWVRPALSRFARYATHHNISPGSVHAGTFDQYDQELHAATLVRNLRHHSRSVRRAWNAAVTQCRRRPRLRVVLLDPNARVLKRLPLEEFPAAFRDDIEAYLAWAAVPDPLDEAARARALSPRSLRLQRQHLHSAASAAAAAGTPIESLSSLAILVEPETVRALLRHLRQQAGNKPTAYLHGVAITLIAVATEWVKAPPETVAALKALRRKVGALPTGLTEKNKRLLATLDDPRLLGTLVQLPDRLWHAARRKSSPWSFVDLQSALAIDILLHAPMRLENLGALRFDVHLHWTQGPRKPVLVKFNAHETKTKTEDTRELSAALGERLQLFRNEIAPAVIGKRPDFVFVRRDGKPKTQAAVASAICKTLQRYLGIKMTPHQFRHLCAKIILDHNPGAYELVRQMLGHTSQKTTTQFYAGIDTRRAGRAHAELIRRLRESSGATKTPPRSN